jgi:rfaE bifunctional protein nucleotidyltransferase chain/domain
MFDSPTASAPANAPAYRRKIVSLDRLEQIVDGLRRAQQPSGPTIVLCHGCFDIVHPGHIRYLEFARTQGDLLVASITGDDAIEKGAQRPYIPQELRAENLAALESVDYVVIDTNPTACSLLQRLHPDVYVKGREYAASNDPRFLAEKQAVESYGGRVIFSSGEVVFSSSRLGELVTQSSALASTRLNLVCKRHGITLPNLTRLLGRIRDKRVLVFGDTVAHSYVLCDATSVASESPMLSLTELDRKDYLGAAAQIAVQAAALGAKPLLITGLGDDPYSERALVALTEAGVEVRAVRPRSDLPVKTRFLVDNQKLLKVDRLPVRPLDSLGERRAYEILIEAASGADAAAIYDSGLGTITSGLLQRIETALRGRVPVLTGGPAEPRGNLRAMRGFDLLCVSERKLRTALNDFGSSLSTLAYQMLHETQAKQMLVSLGKRGLVTFDRRSHDPQSPDWGERLRSGYLPSFAGAVVDSLGCSESVLTLSALALAAGGDLMQAAYLASAAAAVQIAALGLEIISGDALRQWLELRPELRHTVDDDPCRSAVAPPSQRTVHAVNTV